MPRQTYKRILGRIVRQANKKPLETLLRIRFEQAAEERGIPFKEYLEALRKEGAK